MLFVTLEKLGIKNDEAVFIGDTEWDMIAADGANIKFIGLRTEGDKRIEEIKELINLI